MGIIFSHFSLALYEAVELDTIQKLSNEFMVENIEDDPVDAIFM